MNKKLSVTFHKSTNQGTKMESKAKSNLDVQKWLSHNLRLYKNFDKQVVYGESKIDFKLSKFNDVRFFDKDQKQIDFTKSKQSKSYIKWFNSIFDKTLIDKYNKGKRKSRQIINYDIYKYYLGNKNDQAIADQVILQLGDETNLGKLNKKYIKEKWWQNLLKKYHTKTLEILTKIIPDFKIYNSTLHADETTPHLHIIGAPITKNSTHKNGLIQRLNTRDVFSRIKLKSYHIQLRKQYKELVKQINQELSLNNIENDFEIEMVNKELQIPEIKNQRMRKALQSIKKDEVSYDDLNNFKMIMNNKIEDLNRQYENKKQRIKILEQQIIELQKSSKQKDNTVNQLKQINLKLKQENIDRQSSLEDLNLVLNYFKGNNKELRMTLDEKQKRINQLKFDIDQMQSLIEDKEYLINGMYKQIKGLNQKFENKQNELKEEKEKPKTKDFGLSF